MGKDHLGSREFHYRSDFVPHFRFITVDLTFRTHRFVLAEGASEIPLGGVFK